MCTSTREHGTRWSSKGRCVCAVCCLLSRVVSLRFKQKGATQKLSLSLAPSEKKEKDETAYSIVNNLFCFLLAFVYSRRTGTGTTCKPTTLLCLGSKPRLVGRCWGVATKRRPSLVPSLSCVVLYLRHHRTAAFALYINNY